jgi:membrane fusion protein (multidrug efflux system)
MSKQVWLAAGLGALLLPAVLTMGCGSADGKQPPGAAATPEPEKEKVPVEVAAVRQERMTALYSTSASLRAARQATVTTRTGGVIRRLLVEEGQAVRAGQPLAELDSDEQRIAHERAQTTFDTRQREAERVERLFQQQLVSEDAYEKARRDARDARHALDLAQLELTRTAIEAPFAGVVVRRHLDVGNTVTTGTPVYTLADVSPLYADVNVPERHVARLHAGQQVQLTPDASPQGVAASIERIAPAVDPGTGTVKVTLTVPGAGHLRPGAFVRVDIVTDEHPQALVVPRSALAAEGQRWYLYRLVAGDKVEKLQVQLGFEAADRVEVMPGETSIAAGDRIVAAGTGALDDGALVEVTSAGGAANAALAAR